MLLPLFSSSFSLASRYTFNFYGLSFYYTCWIPICRSKLWVLRASHITHFSPFHFVYTNRRLYLTLVRRYVSIFPSQRPLWIWYTSYLLMGLFFLGLNLRFLQLTSDIALPSVSMSTHHKIPHTSSLVLLHELFRCVIHSCLTPNVKSTQLSKYYELYRITKHIEPNLKACWYSQARERSVNSYNIPSSLWNFKDKWYFHSPK